VARTRQHTCIVCGRKFPEGQGIVLVRAGITIAFHSKSCLTKFFKLFVERVEEKEFKRLVRELTSEFEEMRRMKESKKKI